MKRTPLPPSIQRLIAAVGLSSIGNGMVLVAFPLLAVTYTRRPALVAGVFIAERIPALALALPAGALIDRLDRRRVMLTVEVLRFIVLGIVTGLVASGLGSLWIVYASALTLGAFSPLFESASAAVLPVMVGEGDLARANGRVSSADVAGEQVVGQALGGLAFGLSRFVPFLADGISFLVSASLLQRAVPSNAPTTDSGSLWGSVRDGLRVYASNRILRLMTAMVAVLACCQGAVMAILVLFATQHLGLKSTGFGLILSIAAIGNLAGALAADRVYERLGGGWALLAGGLGAGISYPLLAISSSPVSATGALTLEAFAVMIGIVACSTLRQTAVSASVQGRARSVHLLVTLASAPIGALLGGLLATGVGTRGTFAIAGFVQLAVILSLGPRLIGAVRGVAVIDLSDPKTDAAPAPIPSPVSPDS